MRIWMSVRVDPEEFAKLKKIAAARNVTRSEVARNALKLGLGQMTAALSRTRREHESLR